MSDRPHTPRGERLLAVAEVPLVRTPSRPRAARLGARLRARLRRSTSTQFEPGVPSILAFAVIAALFVLRLAYLQVIAALPWLRKPRTRMSYDWIEPRRRTIYDRNGVVLATSVESTTIYIDPVEVDDADATPQCSSTCWAARSPTPEAITAPNTRYAVVKEKADVAVGDASERVRELGFGRVARRHGLRYPL
ncbi:MAG: hypothetical protein ACLSVD_09455 [Eggerthellaceae bacterium]